jgi:hypothetical protein
MFQVPVESCLQEMPGIHIHVMWKYEDMRLLLDLLDLEDRLDL